MPFVVDVRRINSWKSRQKPRLEVYELPIIPESTRGKTPGQRALNYFLAALMLGGPLLVFFIFLVPFAPQLGRGAQIFAYLVFAASTIAMVKNFFPSSDKLWGLPLVVKSCGRQGKSSQRILTLWQLSDVLVSLYPCHGKSGAILRLVMPMMFLLQPHPTTPQMIYCSLQKTYFLWKCG